MDQESKWWLDFLWHLFIVTNVIVAVVGLVLEKVGSLLSALLRCRARLVVGFTLLGSGLVMKLAPAFDLLSFIQAKLPIEMGLYASSQDITSAFASFAKISYIKEALAYLGLNAHSFMNGLANIDLICAMLIFLPKGRRPAQVVGFWMMAHMIGAEYCVRKSGVYKSPVQKLLNFEAFMTLVHCYISFEGLQCLRSDALGLSGWLRRFLPASVQQFSISPDRKMVKKAAEFVAKRTKSAKTKEVEVERVKAKTVEEHGSVDSNKNRSATPRAQSVKKIS